jgi:kumamolisin
MLNRTIAALALSLVGAFGSIPLWSQRAPQEEAEPAPGEQTGDRLAPTSGARYFAAPAAPSAAPRQQLRGHVTREMASAPVVGRVPPDTRLGLTVGLPVKDRAALRDAVRGVSDPRSPSFRHHVSPEKFGETFGASEADYQAVLAWATANHFTVTPHANRLTVRIFGSAADVEAALDIHLDVAERADGTRFHLPDREPSVALSVPIAHIGNLDDYAVPEPYCSTAVPSSGQCAVTLWPSDVRNAYLGGGTANGAGQIVAIDSAGPCFNQSDIDQFAENHGLAALGFTADAVVSVNTDVYCPGGMFGAMWECSSGQSPSGETTLDIEMVTTMAPAATIQLVGGSANLVYYAAHPEISQITYSHGHSFDANDRILLGELSLQGQSVFYASGDGGAYGLPSEQENIDDLAEQDFAVTTVGGTVLTMSGSKYGSETAWCNSGGGVMKGIALPAYQENVNPANPQVSTTNLNAPDVSATAYCVGTVMDQGVYFNWGTSSAAPLWGGFMALVNQKAQANGNPATGFANPALYASATHFHRNITQGSNPTASASLGCDYDSACNWVGSGSAPATCACYDAEAGYNLVTGLGTPTPALLTALSELPCGTNGEACAPAPAVPPGPPAALPVPDCGSETWNPVACVCTPVCQCGTFLGPQGQRLCKLCTPDVP